MLRQAPLAGVSLYAIAVTGEAQAIDLCLGNVISTTCTGPVAPAFTMTSFSVTGSGLISGGRPGISIVSSLGDGADVVVVSANATLAAAWTATADSSNGGYVGWATLSANGSAVSLAAATGAKGWKVSNAGLADGIGTGPSCAPRPAGRGR